MDFKWNHITEEMRKNPCNPGEFFPCLNELVLLNVNNNGIILGYLKIDGLDEHGYKYSWFDVEDDSRVASTDDPKVESWIHVAVVADAIWRKRNGV